MTSDTDFIDWFNDGMSTVMVIVCALAVLLWWAYLSVTMPLITVGLLTLVVFALAIGYANATVTSQRDTSTDSTVDDRTEPTGHTERTVVDRSDPTELTDSAPLPWLAVVVTPINGPKRRIRFHQSGSSDTVTRYVDEWNGEKWEEDPEPVTVDTVEVNVPPGTVIVADSADHDKMVRG